MNMPFWFIASLLSFTAVNIPLCTSSILPSVAADITPKKLTYQQVLQGIEDANTERQLFCQLKALGKIEVEYLPNPFECLVQLSQVASLKKASLPIKTYFTYQLYTLCIKIFYLQSEKKQYITASEKKEVIEQLNLLCEGENTPKNSEIVHNVACVITFIKAFPQNEHARRSVETLYQLIATLLNKKNTTKKELEVILKTQLEREHNPIATYLILLELLKVHYIKKADLQTFNLLKELLTTPELPLIVQYRMQQILGEILRTLIDKGKQYEAYYYMDQLLPLMPKLLLPLSTPNPLDDLENSQLAQGLLIEWCLISPYLYALFDLKESSHEALEAKIQEKINEKELQAWFPLFQSRLQELGLLTAFQPTSSNTLQTILQHKDYFQTIYFMLAEERPHFCGEDASSKHIITPSYSSYTQENSAALKLLDESLKQLYIETQSLSEELKKITKTQQDNQKTLQNIQSNTKAPQIKEYHELLSNYSWLYPPYIWLIAAGLILLLLLMLTLLIRNFRKNK